MTGRYQDSESLPNKRKRPLYDGSPSSCVGPQPRKRISFGDTCRSPRSDQTVTVLLPNSTQVVFSPPSEECPNFLQTFLSLAQRKAQDRLGELVSEGTRNIQWGPQIWLEDYQGKRITGDDALRKALTHPTVLLQVNFPDTIWAKSQLYISVQMNHLYLLKSQVLTDFPGDRICSGMSQTYCLALKLYSVF